MITFYNNEKEKLNYWWSEGFTDYYSRVLALRSGGISIEDFISECNQFLKNYYLSPVLNESNARIQKDFWKDYDVEKLPYYRGFVFAMYLNHPVKQNNNSQSLDNIMLDLFKSAKHKEFSIEYFKSIVKCYIPQGIDKQIFEFIDKGKTIDLHNITSILPIERIEMGVYDLGFDKQALEEKKVIKNICVKSNAYKAGLRNGDKLISWSFKYDLDQIATVVTAVRTFIFKPEHPDKKMVYQFKSNLLQKDKVKIKTFFGAI